MKTTHRKLQHIEKILGDPQVDRLQSGFDRIQLIHRALPEIDFDEIDTSTSFFNRKLALPLLISSMTGGDDEKLVAINQNLAKAAQSAKVALAVGSMRSALESPSAKKSFDLRSLAPDVPLLANLGAVQLNYGYSFSDCQKLVDWLQADALILHLNPLQEAVQPEGNRNFKGLFSKIEQVVRHLSVPIIVKEVGSGFCLEDLKRLVEVGVTWIDVAGRGGTSWSRIEAHRSSESLGFDLQDWGILTPQVLQLAKPLRSQLQLIASGGVRTGVDILKSLILGASLGAMAKPFLDPALLDEKAVVSVIERLKREIKVGMFLLGQAKIKDLIGHEALILENGFA